MNDHANNYGNDLRGDHVADDGIDIDDGAGDGVAYLSDDVFNDGGKVDGGMPTMAFLIGRSP